MMHNFADALRKAVAVQVAILEVHDSNLGEDAVIKGLEISMKELSAAVKKLLKDL